MKVLFRLLVSLLVVLALDGATKILAEQYLALHQPVPVVGDYFRLTLGYNTGVAFGMFANGGLAPLIVTGVIIVALVIWFSRALYTGHFPGRAAWPIGLLLGGAIGNFVDRLPDKRVTDFLDVGLGATRWETIRYHVLPQALPGILTGTILSLSRAIGEAAPMILIGALAFVPFVPKGPLDEFTVIPIQIFNWVSKPQAGFQQVAAAGSIVLLVALLSLNAVAILLRNKYMRRY